MAVRQEVPRESAGFPTFAEVIVSNPESQRQRLTSDFLASQGRAGPPARPPIHSQAPRGPVLQAVTAGPPRIRQDVHPLATDGETEAKRSELAVAGPRSRNFFPAGSPTPRPSLCLGVRAACSPWEFIRTDQRSFIELAACVRALSTSADRQKNCSIINLLSPRFRGFLP